MVVASSLEEARALCAGSGRLLHDGDFLSDEPDQVIPLAPEYQPQGGRIWVYPDVGGCDE